MSRVLTWALASSSLPKMNCFLVLAFIAPLLLYGTTVDARRHGDPGSGPGFHGHGSIGNAEDETRAEHHPFKFFGVCSHSHRPRHPWLPDFLKNVSSDGVKEFCNIVTNENLTKAESEQQLQQWAQRQGVYVSSLSFTPIINIFEISSCRIKFTF